MALWRCKGRKADVVAKKKEHWYLFVWASRWWVCESFSHQPNLNLVEILFSYHVLLRLNHNHINDYFHRHSRAGGLETHLEPSVCFFFYNILLFLLIHYLKLIVEWLGAMYINDNERPPQHIHQLPSSHGNGSSRGLETRRLKPQVHFTGHQSSYTAVHCWTTTATSTPPSITKTVPSRLNASHYPKRSARRVESQQQWQQGLETRHVSSPGYIVCFFFNSFFTSFNLTLMHLLSNSFPSGF